MRIKKLKKFSKGGDTVDQSKTPLPGEFLERMRLQLGDEYPEFLEGFRRPAYRGVRVNTLKCAALQDSLPFPIAPSPFSKLSFYAQYEGGFGRLPAHHAGMFYSQEPSASSAVTALDPRPGERVLDLCAAPGGKATQIAGAMAGRGLLWANEPVKGRAGALLSNLERLGVKNAVVSCCYPQRLCPALEGYFDRVLVDAPCSGEGMFRRDPGAIAEWSPEGVRACAKRQLSILDLAAITLREGGVLVYSTCTFSYEENEGVVKAFLSAHPEFEQESIPAAFGRADLDGGLGRRIYPMDGGEGHFAARFRRVGSSVCRAGEHREHLKGPLLDRARGLLEELFTGDFSRARILRAGDRLLLAPEELPELSGLSVLRAGVELCEVRSGRQERLEPCHGIFMSKRPESCRSALTLPIDGPGILSFLRGEELDCGLSGYTAVCVNGAVTGFGKASGGRLKNRYPKGLRNLS